MIFFLSIHWNCSNILIYTWSQCIIHLTSTRYNLNGDLTRSLTVRVVIKCLRRTKNVKQKQKTLMCSPPEMPDKCQQSGLFKSWPCCTSEAAWSRHHFPSPPSSTYFWFDTQLCSAPCTGSRSCWSFQEFLFYVPAGRRGRKQLFFPSSERLIEMGKTENLKFK